MTNLDFIFNPKSIAIVGVSSNPDSLTNRNFFQPLLDSHYRGEIYPVNPRITELSGLRVYPSILDIPRPLDAVLCAVPAPLSVEIIRQCAVVGVKSVTLFTAGFSETGSEEGRRLENEILDIARKGGVRLVGPNCMGVHHPAIGLTFESAASSKPGHAALLSQSGGNTRELILAGAQRGLYFSKGVSYGNAADLNESDFLEYFGRDPETRMVGAYIEGIKQPPRFLRILRDMSPQKPVVILKGGRTSAGTRAVVSHTSSLAGDTQIWDAVCRQAGVVQAGSLPEMVDLLLAFSYLKQPKGKRVGILGIGGGATVQAADDCEIAGLTVPSFPTEIRQELSRFTPSAGTGLSNPIDTSSDVYWEPALFAETARIMAGYPGIDMIFVMFATYQAVRRGTSALESQIDAILELSAGSEKPMAVILFTAGLLQGEKVACEVHGRFVQAGLPVFPTFSRAAHAVSRLISYNKNQAT